MQTLTWNFGFEWEKELFHGRWLVCNAGKIQQERREALIVLECKNICWKFQVSARVNRLKTMLFCRYSNTECCVNLAVIWHHHVQIVGSLWNDWCTTLRNSHETYYQLKSFFLKLFCQLAWCSIFAKKKAFVTINRGHIGVNWDQSMNIL